MNAKILILLLVGASFLFLGCAKKGEQPETTSGTGEAGSGSSGTSASPEDQELAGLFNIDTDKPIGDEGLSTSTPKSNE